MSTIKILCFAILGMIVGNAECALPPAGPVAGTNVLDFDTIANIRDNIPAMFQPKIYQPAGYNVAGPNNLRYVYFTVINNAPGAVPPAPVNFHAAQMVAPNPANERNIYFPADGSQPTTPEAVEYSCANVIDDAITEWYMKMFGVIPFQNTGNPANDYIKAGWDNTVHIQRIISFDASVDGTMVDDPSITRAQISRRNLFEREFRKIAQSPVGRLLLYRLLIEIRRHMNGIGNNGTVANDAHGLNTDGCRDFNRCITISCGDFAFRPGIFFCADPCIYFNNTRCNVCIIGGNFGGGDVIRLERVDSHIVLFHEMIHWYHRLRAPDRANFFITADANPNTRRNNFLWLTYWGALQIEGRKLFSESQWRSVNNQFFDQEEVFTILGLPNSAKNTIYPSTFHHHALRGRKCYLEGDDLCENLYRACYGIALRFGYLATPFTENSDVIKNVMSATNSNIRPYIHLLGNYRCVD